VFKKWRDPRSVRQSNSADTVKISVIVPAFNEEKFIARSLRKIKVATDAFSASGWDSELIVCDNNSNDRTAEKARAAGAVIVFEPVNQISRARNRGASAATGDWLVFVDADSYPSRELFADLAAAIQGGHCLGGGATVRMDRAVGWTRFFTRVWNVISRTKRWAAGSFVFCEAKAFRELGGFSEEFYAAEEIEFSERLKKLARGGGKELVILHRHPLVTSARKAHLYSLREHLGMLLRTLRHRGQNLKDRAACTLWYDGRR
jgi:glycosyltransferase involved in cell wall biosynthesis